MVSVGTSQTVLKKPLSASVLPWVLTLLGFSSQIKHLVMHFCKLPRLALGPADWCLLGSFFQGVRKTKHGVLARAGEGVVGAGGRTPTLPRSLLGTALCEARWAEGMGQDAGWFPS